ncbi:YqiJ family protein [Ahniella affigens]|uniref:YqiJ family protein n=1 Tax=Ahniella affigens TaxID=2021234 RepID=UPI0014766316|nr:YqiJ family protein [Ahniella affigens]
MPNLFTAPENLIFVIALGVVVALAAIEVLAILLGHSFGHWLDGLLPDGFDVHVDGHIDVDVDGAGSVFDKLLGWLHFGKVPTLVIITVYLMSFGMVGLGLQIGARSLLDGFLPGWIAAGAALPLSLPIGSRLAGFIGRLLPRDESQVIKRHHLLGRLATIVIGEARQGSPAQAKLRDEFRTTQYFMVEPNQPGEVFRQGEQVVVVAMLGTVFRAERFDPKLIEHDP